MREKKEEEEEEEDETQTMEDALDREKQGES